MAYLKNYNGTVELIAGITQKGNGNFPLVEANAVQIDETGTRLDDKLANLDDKIEEETRYRRLKDEDLLNKINELNANTEAVKEALTLTCWVCGSKPIQRLEEAVPEGTYCLCYFTPFGNHYNKLTFTTEEEIPKGGFIFVNLPFNSPLEGSISVYDSNSQLMREYNNLECYQSDELFLFDEPLELVSNDCDCIFNQIK